MKRSILVVAILFSFLSPTYAVDKGDLAPDISLPALDERAPGDMASIANYKGKLIYLDFWASWCGPCRKSLPILNEIRAQYGSLGFEVVAINVDEKLSDALGFLDKYPVDYPILLDPNGTMPSAYEIQGMPTAYIIDENGVILHKHVGFKIADRAKIEQFVEKYLIENPL